LEQPPPAPLRARPKAEDGTNCPSSGGGSGRRRATARALLRAWRRAGQAGDFQYRSV